MSKTQRQRTSPPGGSQSGLVAVMGGCYALGTFADNFYKQAVILLAAAAQLTDLQGYATILFSLPFVLFSAWAGWLADRAAKKHIVIAAKGMELAAMLAGGAMLLTGNWTGMLLVLFIMGAQSTLFSPAINGSIPEHFPPAQVPRVNALIKLASTAAILAGMALAGIVLDLRPGGLLGLLPPLPVAEPFYGRAMAALCVIAASAVGLAAALGLRARPPAGKGPGRPFPLAGPLDSLRHLKECARDKALFLALAAEAWFYGIAAIAVISIANLAHGLGYSNTTAGILSALLMVGVAAGSLLGGRGPAESWLRLLVPSAVGMSLMFFLVSLSVLAPDRGLPFGTSVRLAWISAGLFCCGVCGGVYLIPLASFIQVRPPADSKGKTLGASNFLSFVAMAASGAAFQAISLLPPALTFAVYGGATLLFILLFVRPRLARLEEKTMRDAAASLPGFFMRAVFALRYKVEEHGLDVLPAPQSAQQGGPGLLFLPNHPALIDPVLVYARLAGLAPRPLTDARQMGGPLQRAAARIVKAVTIPDLEQGGRANAEAVRRGIDSMIETLQAGGNVLLYPSGRIYRSDKENLRGNSAVARILAAVPTVRVVLVRTSGLWGSSFSRARGTAPSFTGAMLRGLLAVLANGLVFTPRRAVRMEFAEPADLPRDGDKKTLNSYLEAFYNGAEQPLLRVPLFFWQTCGRRRARRHGNAP